ncbi:MAG: leucyl/phenylalanyl-tRNA--protein transferase [Bacteroidetes bacterium]|nr:leucyl/phenylalanyl-tRNA--protein transferase [Bacteroidota bacterium]
MPIFALDQELIFPPADLADPNGIIAVGGDLSPERLILAYESGIFPWFSERDPIIWWSPDPRCVLFPQNLKVSKSMRQVMRKDKFSITYDHAFRVVIAACRKAPRPGQNGTWITPDMLEAYDVLHRKGYAHSVEVWENEELVGGLYGVSLGKCFFGESMFARVSNASKVGFITLVRDLIEKGFELIDCQVYTEHLVSLGAEEISRRDFLKKLQKNRKNDDLAGNWGEVFGRK